MPTTSRASTWIDRLRPSALFGRPNRAEAKVGPTVSSPMGSWSYGFADGSTPTPADGPTYLNVVVATCLGWMDRNFPVADMEVRTVSGRDELGDVVTDHPFMDLMDRPSKLDTFHSFCASYLLSDVCDGTTVFVKVRDGRDGIHSLWWIPPWDVEIVPSETRDADNPIKAYRCRIDGYNREYFPEDVVCIKDGRDPENPLRGLSRLKAGLRSVSTIDRAELYTQTLMRNCGAVSGMLSPSNPGEQIESDNVAALRGQFAENQTGYNNGKPFVSTQGLRFDKMTLSPEDMGLKTLLDFPVAVLCALCGTPAMAVGLPDPGKTYSNLQQAEYMAWRNGIIPRQERFAEALDKQCPELIDPSRERLIWNRSKISVLNVPLLERLDGLTKAAGGPILTPDEARKFVDLGALPDESGGSVRGAAPAAPGADSAVSGVPVADVQATALNGAQVTSLVEIANAVATGALPPESARALIAASFPNLSAEQVDQIVKPLIAFEPPPAPAPAGPSFPPASKSAEREDGDGPFPVAPETKDDVPDDMPPRDDRAEPGNTFGLPKGDPIRDELIRWFNRQMREVLGTIPPDMAEVPDSFPSLANYDDPMASAMTPILSAYWAEAGADELGRIEAATGLDLGEWSVVNPNTRRKIETAAFDFCRATNETTSLDLNVALDRLRGELIEGIVEQGDTLVQLRQRVESVFDNAERWRAQRIAASEASRAVHAAQEAAAEESGVVQGFEWLLSEDACPLCQEVAEKVKRVKLGDRFAEIGTNETYKDIRHPPLHPQCQCTMVHVLTDEFGGPVEPEWGETLRKPGVAERKFNPNRDAAGRFASGGRGGVGSGLVAAHADVAGETLTVKRRRFADEAEMHVAAITGGKRLTGYEPSDVDIPKPGGGMHRIEVKSKSFGGKESLSVHTNALYLKAKDAASNPNHTWHTVTIDARHDAEGGAHRENYSGHDLYYKRAAGAYALKDMYKVKDVAELNKLIKMADKELPPAARGALPKGKALKELKEKADKEREYNNARSKERKARLGAAAYRRDGQTSTAAVSSA